MIDTLTSWKGFSQCDNSVRVCMDEKKCKRFLQVCDRFVRVWMRKKWKMDEREWGKGFSKRDNSMRVWMRRNVKGFSLQENSVRVWM